MAGVTLTPEEARIVRDLIESADLVNDPEMQALAEKLQRAAPPPGRDESLPLGFGGHQPALPLYLETKAKS